MVRLVTGKQSSSLSPDERRAERVSEQVRPPLVDHDHQRVVPLQVELGGRVRHRPRVQLVVQPQVAVGVVGGLVAADAR